MELRHHAAMPGWCKVIGLTIRAVPECEGGGFMARQDQAERIVAAFAGPTCNESLHVQPAEPAPAE